MSNVKVVWNEATRKYLDQVDDKVVYDVARMTLDLTYNHIPMSTKVNSGRLRLSTTAYGVQKDQEGYSLASETNYAARVYNMDNATTHWSTPGTNSQWFKDTWKKNANTIWKQAIERNKQ
jgi:hypothetical protein